jgi:hypothetical protein
MAMTPCRECNAEISTTAAICPRCGAPQPDARRSRIILVGLAALLTLVALAQCNRPEAPAPTPEVNIPAPKATAPEPQVWRAIPTTPPVDSAEIGNCPAKLRDALQSFVVREGMTCDSVSFCSTMSAQNIRITCNNNAYAYRVRNRGAGYYVEFD